MPGASLAGARVPGAPTLPDPLDPIAMTSMLGRLANEMFAAPPGVQPEMPTPAMGGAPIPAAPPTSAPVPSAPPLSAAQLKRMVDPAGTATGALKVYEPCQ